MPKHEPLMIRPTVATQDSLSILLLQHANTPFQLCSNCVAGIAANAGSWLQPYTDYLMYTAVIALPWLSPELHNLEIDPEGLTEFASAVEQYLSIRPRSVQEALNPFDPVSNGEDAAHLSSGSGASFLPQVL